MAKVSYKRNVKEVREKASCRCSESAPYTEWENKKGRSQKENQSYEHLPGSKVTLT